MDETFWGLSVQQILGMEYEDIPACICENSHMEVTAIVEKLTKMRQKAKGQAYKLACSRIISAMINGPDVLDF